MILIGVYYHRISGQMFSCARVTKESGRKCKSLSLSCNDRLFPLKKLLKAPNDSLSIFSLCILEMAVIEVKAFRWRYMVTHSSGGPGKQILLMRCVDKGEGNIRMAPIDSPPSFLPLRTAEMNL